MIFVVKVTLVFLLGSLFTVLLRNRSAATRHFVWALTLGGALALALLVPIAPRLELPVMTAATAAPEASVPERNVPTTVAAEVKTTLMTASAAATPRAAWTPSPLLLLWLAGFGSVILWCAIGHWGLVRLARRASLVDDDQWLALLDEAAALAGVARPVRLLRSAAVGAPMTWGFLRPVVMLPADADEWSAERRRAVLLHELAHVARLDCLVQLAATAACALYWFHPASWMAARRLRNESERACDDRALACGTPAADYASHLLGVACKARAPRLIAATAIGMAQRSTLEARLLSVLDDTVPRRAMSARARAAGAILLALALAPLAAATPVVVRAAAPEAGSEVDSKAAATPVVVHAAAPVAPEAGSEVDSKVDSERAPAAAAGPVLERSLDAAPGEQLYLDLNTGAEVQIQGWDESRVHVRAWLGGRDAADARVTVEREESGVKVRSFFAQRRNSQSTSNRLEIRVPRSFDLRLSSAGGDLRMKDVEGTFRGSTGGGELVLERLSGEARLSTGGGDIRVSDSDLKGSVNTGGGAVLLSRVRGGLRGSSGSGPVLYGEKTGGSDEETADLSALDIDDSGTRIRPAEPMGVLHITKAGGDVELEEAPEGAVISTGGGSVSVGRSAGLVAASTGGGDIEIGPAAGSVRAGTGAGDIHVTLADAGGERQTVDLTSGSGKMIVELPAGFDGRIELETAYTNNFGRATRIDSAWELQRESTQEWDDRMGTPRRYVRARGVLGGGRGLVRIKTVNGDIELRRASR